MFEPATSLLRSATLPRAVLLLNHVVAAEPAATARLVQRVGAVLTIEPAGLPAPLGFLGPAAQPVSLRVTPAGLFEWIDAPVAEGSPSAPAILRVLVDASNPLLSAAKAVAGERPDVRIEGDAAFAADIHWLFENLRWDVEDELARHVGPAAAHQIGRVAGALRGALRTLASGVVGVVSTVAGDRPAPSGGSGGSGPSAR